MVTRATNLDNLKWALQALAQPADVQISLYPEFGGDMRVDRFIPDELAFDLEQWLLNVKNERLEIEPIVVAAIDAIDQRLQVLRKRRPPDLWSVEALQRDERWNEIRRSARAALSLAGWEDVPPFGRSMYAPAPNSTTRVSEPTQRTPGPIREMDPDQYDQIYPGNRSVIGSAIAFTVPTLLAIFGIWAIQPWSPLFEKLIDARVAILIGVQMMALPAIALVGLGVRHTLLRASRVSTDAKVIAVLIDLANIAALSTLLAISIKGLHG